MLRFLPLLILTVPVLAQTRADWMREARFGVMTHFLAEWIAPEALKSAETWNALVDRFDTEALAAQIASTGARYHIMTIGQNSGYFIAPNAAYDRYTRNSPSKCSTRDLVADLQASLAKKLEWRNGPYPNREFQIKWEDVIREWSMRWGEEDFGLVVRRLLFP